MANLVQRQRDGKWIVSISDPVVGEFVERTIKGKVYVCQKRRRHYAEFKTKAEAEADLDLQRSRRAMRKMGLEPPAEIKEKPKDLAFGFYASRILSKKKGLRKNTLVNQKSRLRAITESPRFKGKLIRTITADDIDGHLKDREQTPAAANAELQIVKTVLRQAVEEGLIQRNPAKGIKPYRIDDCRLRILTDQEAELLLAAASPTLAALIRLLLTTGARPAEALAAHWPHEGWDTELKPKKVIIDPDGQTLHIPAAVAKTGKERKVPVSPELLAELEAVTPIEPARKIFPWTEVPRSFDTAVRAAKLRNVTPYTCRHTAASRMLRAGVDIKTVSEILGHSDIRMTSRYCHSNDETKRAAVTKLSAIYCKTEQPADQPAEDATRARELEN